MGAAWILRVPVGISALATIATFCGARSQLSRFPPLKRLERRCFELLTRHPRPIESAPEHSASGHYLRVAISCKMARQAALAAASTCGLAAFGSSNCSTPSCHSTTAFSAVTSVDRPMTCRIWSG